MLNAASRPPIPFRLKLAIAMKLAVGRLGSRKGKVRFLEGLKKNPTIVDVGCGANWPLVSKMIRSDASYIGIDICEYAGATSPSRVCDQYIVAAPEEFESQIRLFRSKADAVVSSHNLEHCNSPDAVLRAMCEALREDGLLYLSFPSEDSVRFPERKGTLNFYDDASHRNVLSFDATLRTLREEGMIVQFGAKRYRPPLLMIVGLVLEPISALLRRVMPLGTTWALYGFETVIWARKPSSDVAR